MTFAAKLKKNEIITITADNPCTLILTNIALGPHEKNANLYIRAKQSKEWILIVGLKKEGNTSYNCAIKLLLHSQYYEEIFAQHGQIHIVGHIQQVDNLPKTEHLSPDLIKITRRVDKGHNDSEDKATANDAEGAKVQGRPKRSANFNASNAVQTKPKINKEDNSNTKREKSLLEMMKNIDQQDSSQSDDQSYEEQSEEEESDESEEQEEEEQRPSKSKSLSNKIQNKKVLKKKSSWAEMLQKEMKARQDSDQEEIQEDEDKTPEVKPKRETRKSAPSQPVQKQSTESTSKPVNNKTISLLKNGEQDSSSFQFTVPNGLPNFFKNQ